VPRGWRSTPVERRYDRGGPCPTRDAPLQQHSPAYRRGS